MFDSQHVIGTAEVILVRQLLAITGTSLDWENFQIRIIDYFNVLDLQPVQLLCNEDRNKGIKKMGRRIIL